MNKNRDKNNHDDDINILSNPNLQEKYDIEKLIYSNFQELIKEMKKKDNNGKQVVSNPHRLILEIEKWIGNLKRLPKLILMLCRVLDNKVKQYSLEKKRIEKETEKQELTKIIEEEILNNWDDENNNKTQYLRDIIYELVNSKECLDLLSIYCKVWDRCVCDSDTGNININNNNNLKNLEDIYINYKNNLLFLEKLDLITINNDDIKISNQLFYRLFNKNLIKEYLSEQIKVKVNLEYFSTTGEVNHNLLPVEEDLLKYISQEELPHILLEGKAHFTENITNYLLINNWENLNKNSNLLKEQKNYLSYIQEKKNNLVNNKNCNSFWLLTTYLYILKNKEILFNAKKEIEQLIRLKLIIREKDNQLVVGNTIYREIFNQEWIKKKILNSNYPIKAHAILIFIISDRFVDTVNVIRHKLPNHINKIIENTIFWTGRNSFGDQDRFEWTQEEQSLTEKILNFVSQVVTEDELYPPDKDQQKWFDEMIMYSLEWKNKNPEVKITQKEFAELIATRVSQEEEALDIIYLRKSLRRLALTNSQLKTNPLYVANLILVSYKREGEKVSKIVDYITANPHIIKNEEYFADNPIDQIYEKAIEFSKHKNDNHNIPQPTKTNHNNQEKLLIMPLNEILQEGLGEDSVNSLQAILLYDFKNKELRRKKYFANTSNQENEPEYIKWIGDGNGGEALKQFRDYLPVIESIEPLKKDRHTGRLKDTIYEYENNPIIGKFIGLEGTPHGVFFITKKGTARGVLVDLCDEQILEKIVRALVGRNKELTL